MSEFISTREIVGESTLEDGLLDGSCSAYTEYKDDLVSSLGRRVFSSFASVVTIDCPNITGTIAMQAFRECKKLARLVLRNNMMASLAATDAFTNTLIASGTGYIYVPRALVDSYKTATNWSTYATQFRALEDYTVDGTIMGELDWDKINAAA